MDSNKDTGFQFGKLNIKECLTKGHEVQNKNTINNEKKAVNIFKDYLSSLGLEDTDFMLFSEDKLVHYLTSFLRNAYTKKRSRLYCIIHGNL